ncbi:MAG: putative zinc ribbon protein [Citrobacter sp.]|uniref:putative zinc ribbon protein n=1 Tax=Citrobacter sp. TaxID=1896336 RepID=UPI002FC85A10
MRILKCYLANNARNKFVNAKEATDETGGHWTCASCGCRLILHKEDEKEGPWFEHIQHSISHHELMMCAWVDPLEKEAARIRKLRQVTYAIDTSSKPPTHWHCVLCSEDYVGNKHCINCHSGIYSIERTPG